MTDLINSAPVRAVGANGLPLAGAKAYFFDTGTTTPATVYTDLAETVAHSSPVVADGSGVFPPIYHSGGALKVNIVDANDAAVPGYPIDPVFKVAAAASAASQISFTPTAYNTETDVQAAIADISANAVPRNSASVTNLDTLAETQFFSCTDTATGAPPGSIVSAGSYDATGFHVEHPGQKFQMIFIGPGLTLERMDDGAGYSDWYQAARFDNSALLPRDDNAFDLGSSGRRFDDVYATNGTINTSDQALKRDIRDISDAERSVAARLKDKVKAFRWKDSYAVKGDDARYHYGFIAQDVQAACEAEGVSIDDVGFLVKQEITVDGQTTMRYGVRYAELAALHLDAFSKSLTDHETRLIAIEASVTILP